MYNFNISTNCLSCFVSVVRTVDLPSSQSTEFFDAQEQTPCNHPLEPPPQSPTPTDPPSERSFGSPKMPDQLPYMGLLPPPTDKHYPTFNALTEDVNKTTSGKDMKQLRVGETRKTTTEIYGRFDWDVEKQKRTRRKEMPLGMAYDKGEDKLQNVSGRHMLLGKMAAGT